MTFVRVAPVNPKAKTHEVTVRLQRSPSSSGRACLVFGIGRSLVESLGWASGQTIACLWGLDEDLGSLRLEPSKAGYTLRNPGRKAAGSLALAVYTFHGEPYRIPDAKCPAETAPHEIRDGGLVVTLPAEWWGTPKPAAKYAENYADPIQAEATSPTAAAEVGEVGIPTTPDLPGLTVEGEGPGHCLVSVPEWMMEALQERGAVDRDGMLVEPTMSQNSASDDAAKCDMTDSEPVEAPPAAEVFVPTIAPFWALEKHTAGPVSQAAPLGRYWTGQFTKIGLPLTTADPRQAMTFVDRREASDAREAAIRNDCPEMKQFRAVRPDLPAMAAA